jgi:hypothetical protein
MRRRQPLLLRSRDPRQTGLFATIIGTRYEMKLKPKALVSALAESD